MRSYVGVYGTGGLGRQVMPFARVLPQFSNSDFVFIDDFCGEGHCNNHKVYTWERFSKLDGKRSAVIAIADSKIREKLALRCDAEGVDLPNIVASNSLVYDNVTVSHGMILAPNVTVTSNITIGRCFHGNMYSSVSHDCVIGDFVTFAPGVRCNGHVSIGDFAYIGAGATIRQGITIGAGAVVGMGAVVVKDVMEGAVVVGNPAKVLQKAL